jgi:hypothetical protein
MWMVLVDGLLGARVGADAVTGIREGCVYVEADEFLLGRDGAMMHGIGVWGMLECA